MCQGYTQHRLSVISFAVAGMKQNIFYVFSTVVGVFFLTAQLPVTAEAQTVVRASSNVSVGSDEVVEGNFYSLAGLGGSVNVSGTVSGDWIALGGSVTANGTFLEDVLVAGGTVQFHGSTTDDVRIVGADVTVAGPIGGSLTVVANSVSILSTAEIQGDILFLANQVEVQGSVAGSVLGRINTLRINSEVGQGIDITVGELTLGERARVAGDITYTSSQEIIRAQAAEVAGSIAHRVIEIETSTRETLQTLFMPLLVMLFATMTFYLLLRRRFERVVLNTVQRFNLAALIGLVVLLVGPLVSILFIGSILGLLVGAVFMFLYILLLIGGLVLAGPVFGVAVSQSLFNRSTVDVVSIGAGTVLLYSCLLIPYIGPFVFILFTLIALGGLSMELYRRRN